MRTLRSLVAGATTALLLTGIAVAQQVRWEEPPLFGAGQRASLDLVFDDTQPAGRVALPETDGLTLLGAPSRQSSTSIINGVRSDSVTLSYPVRAEREGSITIPSFDVETAAGTQTVAALTVEVGAPTLPSRARGTTELSDVVAARLTPKNMAPYAGEVFDIGVIVGLTAGHRGEVIGTPIWNQPGVVAESWSEGQQVSTESGSGVRFHTRAVAPQAGRIEIAPVEQEVAIEVGRERVDPFADFDDAFGSLRKFGGADLFDSFFSRAQKTSATVRSNAVQLDVQPLPHPAPEGFSGAVGQFQLTSTTAPVEFKTGEPITWTLTLKGTGNWPGGVALPARAVPSELRTLQPKQHKDFAAGELFSGALSEDVVLIANQPGDYRLAPVRFVYFDPATHRYETIEVQPPLLHISGAPIASQAAASAAALAAAGSAAAAPVAPSAPARDAALDATTGAPLPHDPLPGSGTGFTPLASTPLALLAGAPLALLIVYWIALAVREARLTDPRRPQRQAYRRLASAIEQVRRAATAEQRIAALLVWQHTAALALGLDLAAPTAEQLPDQRWTELWAGSERGLYGREHALPGGWSDRALAVCTRTRRPRFNPLRAFSLRHLVPKTAAAALLLALAVAPARANEPVAAETQAERAAAHENLRARVSAAPSDWVARYNLGLSAARAGDLPRALAETTAAFVHSPRNASVRWNASAFAARVPGLDHGVAALIAHPGLAGLASPAVWQGLMIAATFGACSGAALLLRRRYSGAATGGRIGLALLAAGVLIGAAGALGLRSYGALADPRAALVAGQPVLRSVPTDAEQAPQQKPIAPGTLVVVERDFLGWVKVGLRGGQTGWLRHGDLVPLYAAPSA